MHINLDEIFKGLVSSDVKKISTSNLQQIYDKIIEGKKHITLFKIVISIAKEVYGLDESTIRQTIDADLFQKLNKFDVSVQTNHSHKGTAAQYFNGERSTLKDGIAEREKKIDHSCGKVYPSNDLVRNIIDIKQKDQFETRKGDHSAALPEQEIRYSKTVEENQFSIELPPRKQSDATLSDHSSDMSMSDTDDNSTLINQPKNFPSSLPNNERSADNEQRHIASDSRQKDVKMGANQPHPLQESKGDEYEIKTESQDIQFRSDHVGSCNSPIVVDSESDNDAIVID
ncbi:15861_t:CDS:1 [Acaulospora morrowiae]|uniref:15861_t:CDS:1 n=1 Tax=Acaulospora morrowiae TaxID=94023 RepID=A0A9N8ZI28_9GLOM|nr:15861_t:CDS:1 [Acaulospora morrowiae]